MPLYNRFRKARSGDANHAAPKDSTPNLGERDIALSEDKRLIVRGVVGSCVVISLEQNKEKGQTSVEVKAGENGRVILRVRRLHIEAHEAVHILPRFLLEEVPDEEWKRLSRRERELTQALRWACSFEIKEVKKGLPLPKQLTAHRFKGPASEWKNTYFVHAHSTGAAYFSGHLWPDGKRTLSFRFASERHTLAPILERHGEVEVCVATVFDPTQWEVGGDIRFLKNAKRQIAYYLGKEVAKR